MKQKQETHTPLANTHRIFAAHQHPPISRARVQYKDTGTPFGAGQCISSPFHLVPDFLVCMEEQGLGFNLVSLTKGDTKAWNSHWKCEDLLS